MTGNIQIVTTCQGCGRHLAASIGADGGRLFLAVEVCPYCTAKATTNAERRIMATVRNVFSSLGVEVEK